jgi:NAD(P)H dehydrogenase (quinone)
VARTIRDVTGREVAYHDETVEEAYASRQPFGAPDWEIEGWVGSYLEIASGNLDVISDTVHRLAGDEPVALAEYLRAHPESLDHVTVS